MYNLENIKLELEQCLDWAEYANDFCSDTIYYDSKIQPLESEYFEVSEIKSLYHYLIHFNKTLDSIIFNQLPAQWGGLMSVASIGDEIGAGNSFLDAAKDAD